MKKLLLLMFLSLPCSANDELYWQLMHIIDVGQTVAISKSGGWYTEQQWPTRNILTPHPKESDVYYWGVASAIGHYFFMKWLDDNYKDAKYIRRFELFLKASTIANNHSIGLRISF